MSTAATNTLNAALNCKRRQLMGCPNILLLSFCRTPIKAMSLKYVWENATPAVGFFVTKPNKKLVDFKIASDGRSKLFHLMIKLDVDTERNALLTSFPCASVSETPDRISAVVPALIPLGLALLYALAFRQGKPSGYDIDLFELWLKGAGFGPAILRVKAPPLFSSNDDV